MSRAKADTKKKNVVADGESGEVAAVWTPVDELRPWSKNPRLNDGEPLDAVLESIKKFGFGAPIIATEEGEIIAGHTRWKASKKLGLKTVPVRFMPLEAAKAHALALADNKLGELAEWDDQELANIVRELQLEAETASFLDAAGFSASVVADLLAKVVPPTLDELGKKWGAPEDPNAWPVLKFSLPLPIYQRARSFFAALEGDDPEKMTLVLDQLGAPPAIEDAPVAEVEDVDAVDVDTTGDEAA